jgi:hypothetical protein
LAERRDEGLELIGGGGGVREEEFFMSAGWNGV